MKKKWKNKDGSIKIYQIRTNASYDTTLEEMEKYMDFLGVPPQDWRLLPDSFTGKVILAFHKDDVHYLIDSEKQTRPKGKPSIKDNARAILHIIQARVREMRKGAETLETAFGGVINILTTPKLPPRMDRELKMRGIDLMLPIPKSKEKQLEEEILG